MRISREQLARKPVTSASRARAHQCLSAVVNVIIGRELALMSELINQSMNKIDKLKNKRNKC